MGSVCIARHLLFLYVSTHCVCVCVRERDQGLYTCVTYTLSKKAVCLNTYHHIWFPILSKAYRSDR